MQRIFAYITCLTLVAAFQLGCDQSGGHGHDHGPDSDHSHEPAPASSQKSVSSGGHHHADGTWHDEPHDTPAAPGQTASGGHQHADGTRHAEGHGAASTGDDHVAKPLESIELGGMTVKLAQSHGSLAAGKESHLVVTLPLHDHGATVVRAWIGSEDRTLSYVGKGEYSDHQYDIHATAPDPLPEDAKWWIEVVLPDGKKLLGSTKPIK